MCGIIGEVGDEAVDVDCFRAMRDELEHRGPDGSGLYVNESGETALGHRRLAIIDLTDAGCQPMENETGDVHLVFNGEIYNYRDLRDQLHDAGHTFQSDTDSEVIIHGYEEWGTDVVERLGGMFAFGIWDETRERLFIARDRVGIKPLYYYQRDGRFVFASELKAIVRNPQVPRRVDPDAVRDFLLYRYVPAPNAIWENTHKLCPGEYLVYDGEEARRTTYWQVDDHVDESRPEPEDAVAELETLLESAVSSHLVSDVPVGVLLSGGLDSSLVTAFASTADDLRAYTMGFDMADGSDGELSAARAVADAFDVPLSESRTTPESMSAVLEDLLYYYDEPLADSSIVPTFLLMRTAAAERKVVLSGDGGDELFAGYRWYDWCERYDRLDPASPLFAAAYRVLDRVNEYVNSDLLGTGCRVLEPFTKTGAARYRTIMNPRFDEAEVEGLLNAELASPEDRVDPFERRAKTAETTKDRQLIDFTTFLPNDVLAKVDRASMAQSVEVRVPLLDHHLVEWAMGTSGDLHRRDGEKKQLLRRLGERILPPGIVDQPKEGFGAPLDELGFIDEHKSVLSDSVAASDGLFDQAAIDRILAGPTDERKLVSIILFELWYRRWAASDRNSEESVLACDGRG